MLPQEFNNLVLFFDRAKSDEDSHLPRDFFKIPEGLTSTGSAESNFASNQQNYGLKDKINEIDNTGFKRSNRQNIILGLLRKKKELTIKDIALVIKDCSEKTIQRELISFIEAGVIKKTGERRWSKYSLNS